LVRSAYHGADPLKIGEHAALKGVYDFDEQRVP
jgi:hypothetical protein